MTARSEPSLGQIGDDIASVIGREQTLRLIGAMPRSPSRAWRVCFYVPKVLPLDHQLVRVLGYRDAALLCRVFGGMILQPAHGSALLRDLVWREIRRRAREEDLSARVIAAALDMPRTTVVSVLERSPC